ncbi:MAG TPA: glycoside hydrolase family 76 protein [Chloroflexia bacterium]|nr:glycoside hydrolase family 76 protein [Chloroflexia bacterium]
MVLLFLGASLLLSPGPRTAQAFSSTDADNAMNAFVNTFWNSGANYFYTNSDHQVHSQHAFGPSGGLYSDFWWEAQLWEVVMDAYQRTNSATYRSMLDSVYNGWTSNYPNPTSTNDFNDDLGWWALASARAYELTGNTAYRTEAKFLFDSIYSYYDSTTGGGIWWKRDVHDQKNVATNAPAVITAVKLSKALGDSTYLTKAQNIYNWLKSVLQSGGHVYDHVDSAGTVSKWDFTYNFGTFIGAADALYGATNNTAYLNDATSVANWATTYLTIGGTVIYEGTNGTPTPDDAGGFKMIFARYLNELASKYGQSQYLSFLQKNATQAWNHRRTSDNLVGPDWSAPAPTNSYLQSMTAASGADILQFIPSDNYQGIVAGSGTYEAENGVSHNINSESTSAGFNGRGYLAGWNSDGQWVDFNFNLANAGTYNLTFRYAAGAGNASRLIYVNGSNVVTNQSFANTGSWSSWNTVTISNVSLNAGSNTVSVIFNSSNGSSNYLNLDQLTTSGNTATTYQAENGTLHSLSVESTYSGYHGTGYLAGWNSDGQWVDLGVNVNTAGNYNLTFRYAAAAGNASRYIYVNGVSAADNLVFSGTASWSTWNTVTISGVHLNAGSNTVSVIYNSSKGSSNYLNLDEMTVQ